MDWIQQGMRGGLRPGGKCLSTSGGYASSMSNSSSPILPSIRPRSWRPSRNSWGIRDLDPTKDTSNFKMYAHQSCNTSRNLPNSNRHGNSGCIHSQKRNSCKINGTGCTSCRFSRWNASRSTHTRNNSNPSSPQNKNTNPSSVGLSSKK